MNKNMDISVHNHVKLMIKTLNVKYRHSLNDLIDVFASRKYEIRLAGQTARDILSKKIPKTLELVSSASLYQMKKLFKKKKIPLNVNLNEATITLRYGYIKYIIGTICPVEITSPDVCAGTLKAYWMIYAYNHIFTINSIFIDYAGGIYDYFNGYDDVMNYQIRMNLDPDTLINMDYLRMLRYFKLFGTVAKSEQGHDPKTLEAILGNINGLASVKGELVWSELRTMLMHPKRYECIEPLIECGGAKYLGLPENLNLNEFKEIASHQSDFVKHPLLSISYLCALLETREDVMKLHQRLRLSAYERDLAIFIVKHKTETRNIDDMWYYRKMCLLPSGANKQICREYVLELLKYHNKKALFNNMLSMQSSFHHIDPVVLQWKKRQLRTVDGVNLCYPNNDNESDSTKGTMKQPLLIGTEWSVIRYTSSKKKQRLQ